MLSSSAIPVTVDPDDKAKLVDTVNVPSIIALSLMLIFDESDDYDGPDDFDDDPYSYMGNFGPDMFSR